MAKLTGLFRKQRGSIGDVTFRQLNGQTVTSEKATSVRQPRTFSQMLRRVVWRNVQNFWSATNNVLHPSFESIPRTWNDYNAFMSANLGRTGVYLDAETARQGGCVVAPYQVTRGSLPSIGMGTNPSGIIISDVKVGSLVINDETTLAAFSAAVKGNNTGWADGDQLSVIIALQKVNAVTNVPFVETSASEITLDTNDDETLVVDLISDARGFNVSDQKLGLNAAINGGAVYIHSRKEGSKTRVSTQFMEVTNDMLATYTSANAQSEAILSYGGKVSNQFLTPNIDEDFIP